MWYNDGMTTSDWITLGAAILVGGGTLFLGFMAWRTIRQTKNIQKAEKRERLLNEIIEWAEDVAKSAINRRTLSREELWKAKLSYKFHKAKSKYIEGIVGSSFKDFYDLVEEINTKLDRLIEVTIKFTKESMAMVKNYQTMRQN